MRVRLPWVFVALASAALASGCRTAKQPRNVRAGPPPAPALAAEQADDPRFGSPTFTVTEELVCELDPGRWHMETPYLTSSPSFAPFPPHMLRTVALDDGRKADVVRGVTGPDYADYVRSMVFTPDGQHHAYIAREEFGDEFVVVDGKVVGRCGYADDLCLSDDGAHYAYLAASGVVGSGCTGIYRYPEGAEVIYDGRAQRHYGHIEQVRLSRDGSRLAYVATHDPLPSADIWPGPGPWFVVADGQKDDEYKGIHGLTFSDDGRRLAYMAATNHPAPDFMSFAPANVVVVDLREGSRDHLVTGLTLSPDGAHVAYIASDEGGEQTHQCVVLDGREGPWYGEVRFLTFSPDSSHSAYVASDVGDDGARAWLVLDGKVGQEYEMLGQPVFSADAKHLAYWARLKGRWHVSVDGNVLAGSRPTGCEGNSSLPDYFRGNCQAALPPVFSRDGRRVAYWTHDDSGWRMVVDGEVGPAFDTRFGWNCDSYYEFSPDSRHFAYAGANDDECILVYDGGKVGSYRESSFDNVVFDSDGCLHYTVARGDRLLHGVCAPLPQSPPTAAPPDRP